MTFRTQLSDLEQPQHLATLAARQRECQQINTSNSQFLLTL